MSQDNFVVNENELQAFFKKKAKNKSHFSKSLKFINFVFFLIFFSLFIK